MYSIIILCHNKCEYTQKCLESILDSEGASVSPSNDGYEVIVLDNGSTDNTKNMLHDMALRFQVKGQKLRLVFNGENIGCSTARNWGMALARGNYLVYMDNDTMVKDPLWLEKMREALDSDEKTMIVGPKMVYPFEPYKIQCAGAAISRTGRVQFTGRNRDGNDPRFNQRRAVQCLISACWMFKRSLYEEIGGMDEAFNPIQFEDFDYCYRAREKGYKVVYTPDVEMYHWESVTSDGTPTVPNKKVMLKNWFLFKKKWRYMYQTEDGPPDEECAWERIEVPSLEGKRER